MIDVVALGPGESRHFDAGFTGPVSHPECRRVDTGRKCVSPCCENGTRIGSLEEKAKGPTPCVLEAQLVRTPIVASTMKAATRYIQLRFLGVSLDSVAFDMFSIFLVGSVVIRVRRGT